MGQELERKKGKYNVVTGLGRSGTSVMMLILRQSGIPITGFRYSLNLPELSFGGKNVDIGITFPTDIAKERNKYGFWEIPSLTLYQGLTGYYEDIGIEGDMIKVFSGVLARSEPSLVNKAIVMLREPKAMLASMLQCREFIPENIKPFSEMLATRLLAMRNWLRTNKKEYIVVQYEKLIEEPEQIVKEVCQFIGKGDYKEGIKVVDKRLNRSIPRDDLGDISELEEVYESINNNAN